MINKYRDKYRIHKLLIKAKRKNQEENLITQKLNSYKQCNKRIIRKI